MEMTTEKAIQALQSVRDVIRALYPDENDGVEVLARLARYERPGALTLLLTPQAGEPLTADKLEKGTVFRSNIDVPLLRTQDSALWLDCLKATGHNLNTMTVTRILGTLAPDGTLTPYTGPQPGGGKVRVRSVQFGEWFLTDGGVIGAARRADYYINVVTEERLAIGDLDLVTPLTVEVVSGEVGR